MFIQVEKYLLTRNLIMQISVFFVLDLVSAVWPIGLGLVGYVYFRFNINTITAGIRDKPGFLSADDCLAGHGWSEVDIRIRQSDCIEFA